jgi:Tol biopolymer transport system component
MVAAHRRPVLLVAVTAALTTVAPLAARQQTPSDSSKADEKASLPLQPTRSLAYTADEGTWISVDVSPDGRTVVFDLLGDLYTVPIAGGQATRLTGGLAFDGQPRYSPDGSKVLFVSDRSGGDNLWTIDVASGDTTQLTKGDGNAWISPEWTPDGEYVVASKGETRLGVVKLWIGHVDGGSGVQLHKEPATLKTVGAAVSPDGRYIWYARRQNSWDYNASFPQYQLAVYDRDTGRDYSRTSRYGSGIRPTLSPDGRWLVYATRYEDGTALRIRDMQSGDERWLHSAVQRDDMESIADRDAFPGMSFTPDSREVVTSFDGKIWRIPVDAGDPVEVPFTAQVDLPLGPELSFDYDIEESPTFAVRQIRDAVPSPDGSKLAFVALDRLYVMDYPRGQPRRVTSATTTEAQPVWSPDGSQIAWITWTPEGGHILRAPANGGQPAQVTRQVATWQQIAWSPDGSRIVAIRGPARAWQENTGPGASDAATDIVQIPANGGDATLVAPTDGRSQPHFTADPDRIYLFHGQKGIVSIRWDGTDEKAHVKVVGNTRPGQTQPNQASIALMAPTGSRALAQVNNHLYVVTVPRIGGETPTISVANPENAAFPARKLTEIGGQFPAWASDGNVVHWSIGNAHFRYDLDRAEAFEDSVAAAKEEAAADSAAATNAADSTANPAQPETRNPPQKPAPEPSYQPDEHRITINVTRDMPDGVAVLRGARVITMRDDAVIENADIVITDNRISAVGARGSVTIPQGAREIDVTGTTIVPGFVDTHSHMWPAWGIHKTQVWMYLANLAYGVTTTRDPQTSQTDVITYGDLVESGEILGPRVYSTGPGVFGDYVEEPIRDLEHARDILKRYSEYYDTKTIKMYMAGNRQQRQWVIMAAKEQGLMPTTEGGLMMKYDLTLMQDGYSGLEHALPQYPLHEDVVRLTAESGITYTPTLLVSYGGPFSENYWFTRENPHDDPKLAHFTPHSDLDALTRRRGEGWFREEEYVFEDHAKGLADIVEAGGRIGVGSHGQLQGLGYHWELWSMQSGGLSEHDALRAATVMGAAAIGLENDLGSIAPGMLADMVVLDGNPLEDIRNTNRIRYVMKNGRLYEGDTLDEIWPRQKKLQRSEWIVTEPESAGGTAR